MKRIIWALQAGIFYIFTLFIALIPTALAYKLGAYAGLLLSLLIPKRREIAVENISLVLPYMKAHPLWNSDFENADAIARETFKNLGYSLIEVCRLYHGKGKDIIARLQIRGMEHYHAATARGKGVILLTGHCGNWELVALGFSSIADTGMAVVARKQNNPYLHTMVEKMRLQYKNSVIYKQGALRDMLRTLKKNGNIGLLADQAVFPEDGELIDVLGRKAWATKAPVIIAQKSGAAILPSFIHREGRNHVVTINPEHVLSGDMSEEGIRQETQNLSRYVENYVIQHPTQWYWVHRRWKRAGESAK
jgi:Kdo2-lipid IVA lauroyltransferase/acyltransferase